MRFMAIIAAFVFVASPAAEAKHHHRYHGHYARSAPQIVSGCFLDNDGHQGCSGVIQTDISHPRGFDGNVNPGVTIIGSRPDGCPHRYCGCGLARYLGLHDKRLNLAWNWAELFPRESSPRPGLAAVRHGHVMYIEAAAGNGQWLIRDYNSGGGLSRLHVRDVRGYVFVNPGGRMAGL